MLQEFEYKGDKIVQHGENDFVGFYFNADGDIEEVRGKSYKEVCNELDKGNAFVKEYKAEHPEWYSEDEE